MDTLIAASLNLSLSALTLNLALPAVHALKNAISVDSFTI